MEKQQQRTAAMEQIGGRIRRLCAERGLSLAEAQRRIGTHCLSPIVTGRVKHSYGRTLLRIAQVLGVGAITSDRARVEPELERRKERPPFKSGVIQARPEVKDRGYVELARLPKRAAKGNRRER